MNNKTKQAPASTPSADDAAGDFNTPRLVVEETGDYVPEQQAYLQIVHTAEILGSQLTALFERFGLSGKQYNALRAIRRGGETGATASEIGQQMTDRRTDVTRLVDRLVRDGWVERTADASDRRIVRSVLTEKGKTLLSELDAPLIETHRDQLGHLDAQEIDTLIKLMQKVQRYSEVL